MNWSAEKIELLKEFFANFSNEELAKKFQTTSSSIIAKAFTLGLKKSAEYIQALRAKHTKSQFKKGNVSHNKGKKQVEYMSAEGIAKTVPTRFKKGNVPHNAKACNGVIILRYHKRSNITYQYIRVSPNKWQLLHRYVYEQERGKIPKGYVIRFKDGNALNCCIENLECFSLKENMRKNSIHNYNPEQQETLKIISKLKKRIKRWEQKTN